MNRSLAAHPLFVAIVWLAAYSLSTSITLEHLLAEITPASIQLYAKLMAYIAAAAYAGVTLAAIMLYAFACGFMLRWLGESVEGHFMARKVAGSFWVPAIYAWFMVGVVAVNPPRSLSGDELLGATDAPPNLDEMLGLPWLTEAQYALMAISPVVLFLLLARHHAWFNSFVAVAFGAATVSVIGGAIVQLANLHQA